MDHNDFIPFLGDDLALTQFFTGAGARFAGKDENDLPIDTFNNERTLNVCERILDFVYDSDLFFNDIAGAKGSHDMFEDGQGIFLSAQMAHVRLLREVEIDFGVLPNPKFDRHQEGYQSAISIHQAGLASVPLTAPDVERTGIILEALSAESRYTVIPAYFETSLKGKYTRDEESADMLDILFNTRTYDLGSIWAFGGFDTDWLRIMSISRSRDIVSLYERKEGQIQRDIDRLIQAIEKID
jgi:hypothetical protein